MERLTSCLVKDRSGVALAVADPDLPPSPAAWRALAAQIAQEPNLTPFSAEVLADRWERGYSAILVEEGQILAHASCLPVFAGAERARLAEMLPGVPRWPQTDVYEFLTGWTHPGMRKHGVSRRLRRQLLDRFIGPGCLAVGVTVGIGASPVLHRLGWQMAAWGKLAYLSSLFERAGDCCEVGRAAWRVAGHQPYQGDPVSPFDDTGHPWAEYTHLWVSDLLLAERSNWAFCRAVYGDLCRWRTIWQEVVDEILLGQGWLPIAFED